MSRAHGNVELIPYDESWPARFRETKEQLRAVFPTALIEHVGSTSVPGLSSKDTIDVLVGVPDVEEALTPEILGKLIVGGFEHVPASFAQDADHSFLHRIIGDHRTDHVHLMRLGSDVLQGHLLFRNYLRATPGALIDYERAKQELATRFRGSRDDYVAQKQPIVEALLVGARAWKKSGEQKWRPSSDQAKPAPNVTPG